MHGYCHIYYNRKLHNNEAIYNRWLMINFMTLKCSQGSWISPILTEQRRIELLQIQKLGMTLPV